MGNQKKENKYMRVYRKKFGRFKDVLKSHYKHWQCNNLKDVIDDAIYYFNYIKLLRKLK